MAAVSFSTIRDQFATQIETQLSGVTIFKFPQPADQDIDANTTDDTYEWVQLEGFRVNRVESTYDTAAGKRFDVYTLNGQIGVHHTNAFGTSIDDAMVIAETRAQTLLNGVLAAVEADTTLGGNVFHTLFAEATQTMGGDHNRVTAGFDWSVDVEVFST